MIAKMSQKEEKKQTQKASIEHKRRIQEKSEQQKASIEQNK